MDALDYLVIFLTAVGASPFVFCIWQLLQDRKIYKTIEKAKLLQNGIPIQIIPMSNPNQRGARTTIPIKTETENLILRGRGFWSEGVAKRLTDSGGTGILWETTLKTQRIGWLESAGLKYWGLLNVEYSPSQGKGMRGKA